MQKRLVISGILETVSPNSSIMQGSIAPVTIPRAYPRGFEIFFFLFGGLFSAPGHEQGINSLSPGLLFASTMSGRVQERMAKLVALRKKQMFCQEWNAFLEFIERRIPRRVIFI